MRAVFGGSLLATRYGSITLSISSSSVLSKLISRRPTRQGPLFVTVEQLPRSQGQQAGPPKPPGRKPGDEHGVHRHRAVPTHIDELHAPSAAAARSPQAVKALLQRGLAVRDRCRQGELSLHAVRVCAGRLTEQLRMATGMTAKKLKNPCFSRVREEFRILRTTMQARVIHRSFHGRNGYYHFSVGSNFDVDCSDPVDATPRASAMVAAPCMRLPQLRQQAISMSNCGTIGRR